VLGSGKSVDPSSLGLAALPNPRHLGPMSRLKSNRFGITVRPRAHGFSI